MNGNCHSQLLVKRWQILPQSSMSWNQQPPKHLYGYKGYIKQNFKFSIIIEKNWKLVYFRHGTHCLLGLHIHHCNIVTILTLLDVLQVVIETRWNVTQINTLQWRHNERYGVSNHRRLDCLLNRLFRRRSMKTSKLGVTDLCEGNPPVAVGVPSQQAINAENVSIWWCHHHVFRNNYYKAIKRYDVTEKEISYIQL